MNERSATAAPATTVPLAAVEQLLADTLALRDAAQAQMDWLANNEPAAVNTVGSPDHGLYHAALVERDTYAAPLMGLQAIINTARKA